MNMYNKENDKKLRVKKSEKRWKKMKIENYFGNKHNIIQKHDFKIQM